MAKQEKFFTASELHIDGVVYEYGAEVSLSPETAKPLLECGALVSDNPAQIKIVSSERDELLEQVTDLETENENLKKQLEAATKKLEAAKPKP